MPLYDLKLEVRPGYLFARVEGHEDNVGISLGYWREIAGALQAAKLKRVLVFECLKSASNPVATFEVASRLAELGFRGVTIAFVDAELDHLPDNLFGENVARNRGIHGRVFNNVALAQKWMEDLVARDARVGGDES